MVCEHEWHFPLSLKWPWLTWGSKSFPGQDWCSFLCKAPVIQEDVAVRKSPHQASFVFLYLSSCLPPSSATDTVISVAFAVVFLSVKVRVWVWWGAAGNGHRQILGMLHLPLSLVRVKQRVTFLAASQPQATGLLVEHCELLMLVHFNLQWALIDSC